MRARPRPATGPVRALSWSDLLAGIRLVFGNPMLRTPMLLGWLVAFYACPGGGGPLSHSLGGGDVIAGLILAAGAWARPSAVAFSRLVSPKRRLRWMGPLATLAPGILVLFAFRRPCPPHWPSWCSAGSSTVTSWRRTPPSCGHTGPAAEPGVRDRPGWDEPGQGAAMILAGAAAGRFAPSLVIAASGAVGFVVAAVLALSRARSN